VLHWRERWLAVIAETAAVDSAGGEL